MPDDIYFNEVISKDNLIRAWDHVRNDLRNDFAPDVFKYDDVGYNLERYLDLIHYQLSTDSYKPKQLKYIDVPKSTLAVRPGSVPEIEDRIVSYAIINVIAPIIDEKISKNVHSFRVKENYKKPNKGLFKSRMMNDIPFLKRKTLKEVALIEDWYYEWPEFNKAAKRIYETEGYRFLSVSDVSSYFENINQEILKEHFLSLLPKGQKTINLLMNILRGWAWTSKTLRQLGRGIPQGNGVSSFLGNIYLMPFDEIIEKYARKNDIRYIRYMDDIRIFSKSENIARQVLFIMNKELRDLHLNIQGAKTQILTGKEIEKEMFLSGMDELNETIDNIEEAIKKAKDGNLSTGDRKRFESELKRHFQKISRKRKWYKSDRRFFSRMLTGTRMVGSPFAINKCHREIKENPDSGMTAKIVKYFKAFPGRKKIIEGIADFLQSDINKFEHQEACLFLLYRHLNYIPDEILKYMMNVAFDPRRNWFNRSSALVAMANTKLSANTLKRLHSLYNKEGNTDIKKAIAMCLVQLDKDNLINFIKTLKSELNPYLVGIGKYYEAILFDSNYAQKQISTLKNVDINTNFFKEHFYEFFLLAKVNKKRIKESFAKLLKEKYRNLRKGTLKENIRTIYKEVNNVEIE